MCLKPVSRTIITVKGFTLTAITGVEKQVAQRETIAHLTASHQNILNSAQVKDFLNW